jgi:hypothetical protein
MSLNRWIRIIAILSVSLRCAYGGLIELDFSGVINLSQFTSVPNGSTFTGTAFYNSPDVPIGHDPCTPPCADNFFNVGGPMTINVAGSTLLGLPTTDGSTDMEVGDEIGIGDGINWLYINDDTPSAVSATGPISAELDPINVFTLSFAGPSGVFPSAQIPAVFPGMTEWTALAAFSFSTGLTDPGPSANVLEGMVTALSSSPVSEVPEPSTVALALLGGAATLGRLRSRRARRLG